MGEPEKKPIVIDVEDETISRKDILEKYHSLDPETINNELLKEFVQDRRKAKIMLEGYSIELKQYCDALQNKSAKMYADISEQNAKMKYIDDKIVEHHVKSTGQGR